MSPMRWIVGLVLLCGVAQMAGATPEDKEQENIRVGYGEVDITPPLGITMPGYFHERKADGVLDPLLGKALVLTQGDAILALVALDLIGIRAPLAGKIRRAVQEASGIPTDRVFLHATHTHTGGNPSQMEDQLPGQVASAVKKALEGQLAEKQVRWGTSPETTVAFIRRYLMRDGTVRTNPGRGNPNIVRPIGEIDPAVHVIAFEKARMILVSYGLHPDCVGGTKFSADYPCHITNGLKEELGTDWKVVYLNACSGNVNHINVNDPSQRSSYEESRRIGRTIAKAALRAHHGAKSISMERIAARAETVRCPSRQIPEEIYRWAKQELESDPKGASRRKFNEATPSRIVQLAEAKTEARPAEIIAMILGPVGIVGLPAEVFVEVARDIKIHSLCDPTLVIGLTGGSMGYLPHPRGYAEGGYEATFASARHDPTTPILWSDTAVRLLQELKSSNPMVFPEKEWREAAPESQGVDGKKLEQAVQFLKEHSGRDGVQELLIIRNGYLIWKGAEIDKRHGVWSLTKSFTSTALGLLIDDGKASLDTLAKDHLPSMEEHYPRITLRHFTTMTSGYYAVGDEPRGGYGHGPSTTPFTPSPKPLFEPPGSQYAYWDSAMNQFANVLTRIAGESLEDLFQRRIADPIGMSRAKWDWGDFGTIDGLVVNGGSGNSNQHIFISARELARFGHLFLNHGRWRGKQLISASWVEEATKPHVPPTRMLAERSGADGRGVYGYNWWANGIQPGGNRKWPDAPDTTYSASGYNNNDLFIIPPWNMVIVRLGLDQSSDGAITDSTYNTFLKMVGQAIRR